MTNKILQVTFMDKLGHDDSISNTQVSYFKLDNITDFYKYLYNKYKRDDYFKERERHAITHGFIYTFYKNHGDPDYSKVMTFKEYMKNIMHFDNHKNKSMNEFNEANIEHVISHYNGIETEVSFLFSYVYDIKFVDDVKIKNLNKYLKKHYLEM